MILHHTCIGENISWSSTLGSMKKASWLIISLVQCQSSDGEWGFVLFSTNENMLVNIGTAQIQNSSSKNLLGVKIDCKLIFKKHIGSISKKSSAN